MSIKVKNISNRKFNLIEPWKTINIEEKHLSFYLKNWFEKVLTLWEIEEKQKINREKKEKEKAEKEKNKQEQENKKKEEQKKLDKKHKQEQEKNKKENLSDLEKDLYNLPL